ncbi:MAG TPA: phage terminase large subunit family protein [Bacteroidales bacterium]|nr:phage terminase large subunit family protein [Bacteroidales bacterium]
MAVSEWADNYRILSPEDSAEPGQWFTSRAEYQRGIMDTINDPGVEKIVFKKSAQVGATQIFNNIIGYFVDLDPCPILLVNPTREMAQAWSKLRFAPMLRDTPALKGKVKDARSRDAENTVLFKKFPGGHLSAVGANSPAGLAMRPIRVVICDEIDRYPASAGSEGDPIFLAFKRSQTYWNRKLILGSTPTQEDISRIEKAWNESDKRYYFVPCVHCGEFQKFEFKYLKIPQDEKGEYITADAYYECSCCGEKISDSDKIVMIKNGEWRATAEFKGTAGFHIWEAYSPWSRFSDIASSFLEAKRGGRETLQVWINTVLGECWRDEGEKIEEDLLFLRRENYTNVPMDAAVVVGACDVQKDRIETLQLAFGRDDECWAIDFKIFEGDPGKYHVWEDLDKYLDMPIIHESGARLVMQRMFIDSGGLNTQDVYNFCRPREHKRIFPIKGSSQTGMTGVPLVGRPSRRNKGEVKLFSIGTDTGKDLLFNRLKNETPGPNYIHFNMQFDQEFFRQLTAEKRVPRYHKGVLRREYVRIGGRKNEATDLMVYAIAAYYSLKIKDINKIVDQMYAYKREKEDGTITLQNKSARQVRSKGIH